MLSSVHASNPLRGSRALNSNLRVYLERGNEVWNWGFSQAGDNTQLAHAAVANDTADGRLINYDHKVDRNGGDRLPLEGGPCALG